MARKDAVSDWSETPNSNDNVGGINIAENCAAANLNNAIRTVMAQVKAYSLTVDPGTVYVTKNANYTAVLADDSAFFRFTNTAVFTLTAAATLTNGWHCWIMADGGDVTITPDGIETVNGGASLVVSNGSSAYLTCSGTAFYAVAFVSKAVLDGKLDILQPYISVASAATTSIGDVLSQNVTITGVTTITSFGTAPAGTERNISFSSALTLTYNATSLILPYGANITTGVRAAVRAVSLGGANWRVTDYQPTSAPALTAGDGLSSSGSIAGGNMILSLDVYTGSSANQTTFPVGHQIAMYIGASRARNALIVPALHNSDDALYVISSHPNAGTSLAGTWRSRGLCSSDGNYFNVQRVG